MGIEKRINAFCELGKFFNQFSSDEEKKDSLVLNNDEFYDEFKQNLEFTSVKNKWFTQENLKFSLKNWASALTKDNLTKWLSDKSFSKHSKVIAIITAGNVPLVGFHDFLSVLISGHKVLVKQSSNDHNLLPTISKYLKSIDASFEDRIEFTEGKLEGYDAVIATGSNNTARYFEYYFKDKPNVIRKNRNSVAILTGNETSEELEKLGEDIFRYYGLGCRNVSKLLVPKGYDFKLFFEAIYKWSSVINFVKYGNNYDYNKAVYLMSEFDILDNGFFMIKEDKSLASPIATAFYEFYNNESELNELLNKEGDNIQCIVSKKQNHINFGETQNPKLWDYADDVDTLEFLSSI